MPLCWFCHEAAHILNYLPQEIVTTVVSRLRHWPLSIIFDQWKDFASRQQEFKSLTAQMISVQEKLAASRYFNSWVKTYHAMKLAKQHYVSTIFKKIH